MTTYRRQSIAVTAMLRSIDALGPFDDRQIEAIATVVETQPFDAGQTIFSEGDGGADFLFVGAGEVEASRETPVGTQRVASLGPGELCGEISLLDGEPRSSTVSGSIPGVVLRFANSAIAELVQQDPEIENVFLRIFCRSLALKIRHANRVMTQIMAPGARDDRAAEGVEGESGNVDDAAMKDLLRTQGLTDADLEQLTRFLEAKRYAGGDKIFVEGDMGDTLYIVADGEVRISRHIPGMGEEALAIFGRGEVFGEMAWIDDGPRSADAIAHTGGCTVVGITGDQLDGTLDASVETNAQFLKLICQILCRRIRRMNDQLVAYRTLAFF